MIGFELAEPQSLGEALALLDPADSSVRAVSGGTALMLMMKAGLFRPRRLVSLRKLEPELSGVSKTPAGALRIGGMTRLGVLERSGEIRAQYPVLARALVTLSNVRVRNVATLGGHLGHADPHMDLPPLLAALGAEVSVCGRSGERRLPVEALGTGYLETALANDELITAVQIPPLAGRHAAYLKHTTRTADDWPSVGLAVVLAGRAEALSEARIFLGAAADRPIRLREAEAVLLKEGAGAAALERAAEATVAALKSAGSIAADQHGSAAYKRHLVGVLLGRAVRAALQ